MPLRGERADRPTYDILRSLKGGRTGDLHEVDHHIFGRRCVQKTYSTLGLEDTAAHEEPRLLHAIDHPRIVEVLEAQYDPDIADAITFVAVLYEGGSILDALQEDHRLSIHQALRLGCHVLDALAHVHTDPSLRVIHRDVKPANVFLDAARRNAWLGDWGSAARMGADGTVAGVEGSPLYSPPEGGPIDGRLGVTGDVYSTAMTIFEMLNGAFDYASIDPIVVDRRLARGQRAIAESAFMWAPHVPARLRGVLRKALRADPTSRHPSAVALLRELRAIKCVDWTHTEGSGCEGVWTGSWPPSAPVERRRIYRVESTVLAAGPERGRRRLAALQALSTTSRFARFGVDDVTVDVTDGDAVARFFEAVEASAAQRVPAR